MTYLEFKEIVKANGLYQNGISAYGEWGGYPFSMAKTKLRQGSVYYNYEIVMFNFFTTGELPEEFIKEITDQYKKQGLAITKNEIGNIVATVPYKIKADLQIGTELLNALTNAMRENGVTAKEVCAVCGEENCDCIVPKGGIYVPAHYACLEEDENNVEVKTEIADPEAGSYITGAVGAFIAGLLMAIFVFYRMYLMTLFALVPVASYYGYKLFKGKITSEAKAIIGIMPFLQIVIAFAGFMYLSARSAGYIYTLLDLLLSAINELIIGTLVLVLIPAWIFLFMGIAFVFGLINRVTEQEQMEQVGKLSTAVPMSEAKKITVLASTIEE